MEETKIIVRISLVILLILTIFIVQQNYKFRLEWNKIAKRYNLIWEEYTIYQEYKQKTVRLWLIFNILRWRNSK